MPLYPLGILTLALAFSMDDYWRRPPFVNWPFFIKNAPNLFIPMHHDLFLALTDPANRRGHPILAALLYAFCPLAAYWWRQGVKPEVPHDLLWQTLADRAGGRTLSEVLTGYGFESLLAEARDYAERVRLYRGHNKATSAPETLEVFRFEEVDHQKRFGLSKAIEKLGDKWPNFLEYVRLWAFTYPDWVQAFNLAAAPAFQAIRMAFTLPGVQDPAYFPAWLWESQGNKKRRIVGLLVTRLWDHDQLRFMLAQEAGFEDQSGLEIWALSSRTGEALAFEPRIPWEDLHNHLISLAGLAREGPYPPLQAYRNPGSCSRCAFWRQCFDGRIGEPLTRRKLSPQFLEEERDG